MVYVFDIDGTISFNGINIREDIVVAIEKLLENNYQVIFASARPIRDMMSIIPIQFHDCIWIGGNGVFVKEKSEITVKSFDEEMHKCIIEYIQANDIEYMLDSKWDYTYQANTLYKLFGNINSQVASNVDLRSHKEISKLVIFNPTVSDREFFMRKDVSMHYYLEENILDIAPGISDKYITLCDLGIEKYRVFGNDANDVKLFKNADFAYCVNQSEYANYADLVISEEEVSKYIIKEASK